MTVLLSNSSRTLDGLSAMMEAAVGPHEYVHSHVQLPIALLIIEAAKRADDREEWFPLGKWATIQAVQNSTEGALGQLFRCEKPEAGK